jgi:hypothetical protein
MERAAAAGASSFRLGRMSAPRTIRMICRTSWQANMMVMALVRRQAADFEQLEPEGFDLGEHAV